MKVKDVVALAAANLGREDLVQEAYAAASPAGELLSLVRCYNLVENEVAVDYVPLRKEETFASADGGIAFVRFSCAPVEILRVTDEAGDPLAYTLSAEGICVQGVGTVRVQYNYSPAEKDWEDDCAFSGKITARLLSFGVASEYCLSRGQFSEAAVWQKRYQDALRAADFPRRPLRMRSRRWV